LNWERFWIRVATLPGEYMMGGSRPDLSEPQTWKNGNTQDRGKADSATFIKEVEQLARDGDVNGLSSHLFHTNQRKKAEAAAKAISKIRGEEARETLLSFVSYPRPLNDVVWPFVTPYLKEEDAPWLIDIDIEYSRNQRMAAKYKLPDEAVELVVKYLKNNIERATEDFLKKALCSRYKDINNVAFELLLSNDSPDIRKALAYMVQGHGDWRKVDKRSMLAFERLLLLARGKDYAELLKAACNSFSRPVAKRAADLLMEHDSDSLLDMIRHKRYLNAIDIQMLRRDGSPESIARIARQVKDIMLYDSPPDSIKMISGPSC